MAENEVIAPSSTARLVERGRPHGERPLARWSDLSMALWLAAAVPLSFLPRRARLSICGALAHLATATPRARMARANVQTTGGLGPAASQQAVHDIYAGRLTANADIIRALAFGPDCPITTHGFEHVEAALSQGRGVVIWVSDFVAAGDVSKLAFSRAGYRLKHLTRPEHGFSTSRAGMAWLNPIRIGFEEPLVEERVVFDRAHPDRAMQRLRDWLSMNGVVSIMASAHEGKILAETPFLNGRLQFATGALRLAHGAHCPVIPLFMRRHPTTAGGIEIVLEQPLDLPRSGAVNHDVLTAASDYARRLERYVRADPGLWVGWRRTGQVATRAAATHAASRS